VPFRIYIVEDSAVYRQVLASDLALSSHQIEIVGHAETEEQAKDWLTTNKNGWDLLLIDIFLREGTGAGVVRHCKNRDQTQCIFVMTADPIDQIIAHCMHFGADDAYNKVTEYQQIISHCIRLATRQAERCELVKRSETRQTRTTRLNRLSG
jgi:two-component system OmpR family response regulator